MPDSSALVRLFKGATEGESRAVDATSEPGPGATLPIEGIWLAGGTAGNGGTAGTAAWRRRAGRIESIFRFGSVVEVSTHVNFTTSSSGVAERGIPSAIGRDWECVSPTRQRRGILDAAALGIAAMALWVATLAGT